MQNCKYSVIFKLLRISVLHQITVSLFKSKTDHDITRNSQHSQKLTFLVNNMTTAVIEKVQ